MPVSPDLRKRLLYTKYLLFRAKREQAERNDLGVAVSLLLMHDASELIMLAVADHLQLGSKWSFMEFWEKVKQSGRKEPGHRIPMEQLNGLRVGLKHKGTLPHVQTVRDLMPRVDAFCEEVTKDLLDLDFAELSLADLVANDDVRSTLREAEQALANGDKNDAFLKVRLAFDKLHRSISANVALIEEPDSISIPSGAVSHGMKSSVERFQKTVLESVQTLNVMMLGIDPVRYRFFIAETPHVSWTASGLYQSVTLRDHSDAPNEVFHTCFEFVVEVALNAAL